MAKAKKHRAKKRQSVSRAEQGAAATTETLAQRRPCPRQCRMRAARSQVVLSGARNLGERPNKAHLSSTSRMNIFVSTYLDWSRQAMRKYILQASVVVGPDR